MHTLAPRRCGGVPAAILHRRITRENVIGETITRIAVIFTQSMLALGIADTRPISGAKKWLNHDNTQHH